MKPTSGLLAANAAVIAGNVATLAEVAKVKVYLIKTPFVPGPNLTPASFTPADFTGSTALSVASATGQVFLDPATGEWIIQLDEPAGGWHWVTGDLVNLPQTIYGFALVDSTGASLWGTDLLPNGPVLLTGAGQGVDIDQVRFRQSNASLS